MSGNVRAIIYSLETNLMRHSLARDLSRMILMVAMSRKKKIRWKILCNKIGLQLFPNRNHMCN
jgi:hypothetical protein